MSMQGPPKSHTLTAEEHSILELTPEEGKTQAIHHYLMEILKKGISTKDNKSEWAMYLIYRMYLISMDAEIKYKDEAIENLFLDAELRNNPETLSKSIHEEGIELLNFINLLIKSIQEEVNEKKEGKEEEEIHQQTMKIDPIRQIGIQFKNKILDVFEARVFILLWQNENLKDDDLQKIKQQFLVTATNEEEISITDKELQNIMTKARTKYNDFLFLGDVVVKIDQLDLDNEQAVVEMENFLMNLKGTNAITNEKSARALIEKIDKLHSEVPIDKKDLTVINNKLIELGKRIEKRSRVDEWMQEHEKELKRKWDAIPEHPGKFVRESELSKGSQLQTLLLELRNALIKMNDKNVEGILENLLGNDINGIVDKLKTLEGNIKTKLNQFVSVSRDVETEMARIEKHIQKHREDFSNYQQNLALEREKLENETKEQQAEIKRQLDLLKQEEARFSEKQAKHFEIANRFDQRHFEASQTLAQLKEIKVDNERAREKLEQDRKNLESELEASKKTLKALEEREKALDMREKQMKSLEAELKKEKESFDQFITLLKFNVKFDWRNKASVAQLLDYQGLQQAFEELKKKDEKAALERIQERALHEKLEKELEALQQQLAELTQENGKQRKILENMQLRYQNQLQKLRIENRALKNRIKELLKENERLNERNIALESELEQRRKPAPITRVPKENKRVRFADRTENGKRTAAIGFSPLFTGEVARQIQTMASDNTKLVIKSRKPMQPEDFKNICRKLNYKLEKIQENAEQLHMRESFQRQEGETEFNLKMKRIDDRNYKIQRDFPEDPAHETLDVLNIRQADNRTIELIATDLLPKEDVLFTMSLAAKEMLEGLGAKNKIYFIENCENNPPVFLKLYLIGLALGLKPLPRDKSGMEGRTQRNIVEGEYGQVPLRTQAEEGVQKEITVKELYQHVNEWDLTKPDNLNRLKSYISQIEISDEALEKFRPKWPN